MQIKDANTMKEIRIRGMRIEWIINTWVSIHHPLAHHVVNASAGTIYDHGRRMVKVCYDGTIISSSSSSSSSSAAAYLRIKLACGVMRGWCWFETDLQGWGCSLEIWLFYDNAISDQIMTNRYENCGRHVLYVVVKDGFAKVVEMNSIYR